MVHNSSADNVRYYLLTRSVNECKIDLYNKGSLVFLFKTIITHICFFQFLMFSPSYDLGLSNLVCLDFMILFDLSWGKIHLYISWVKQNHP